MPSVARLFWVGRRRRRIGGRRSADKQSAIARDVPVMLGESLAEEVATLVVGDKIQVIGICGVDGSTQRGFTGICDGTRRQAAMLVGVVWRIDLEVLGLNSLFKMAGEVHGVLHSGIALERVTASEPIVEHAGNERAFGGIGRLALDERGQGDN